MSTGGRTTKLRLLVKAAIIVSVSILGFAGIWLYCGFVNELSLKYVDDLRGYPLSQIQGTLGTVDDGTYSERMSLLREFNPCYSAIFPEHISDGESKFFFFAETVKTWRNCFDRWEVYLSCEWSEEKYAFEKARLENHSDRSADSLKRDDLFALCAFVYEYSSGRFAYTLFDESTFSIHYVFLCEVGSIEDIVFDRLYAPTKPWRG